MCQINVVVRQNEEQRVVREAVTTLEVLPHGVLLHSFFEEPLEVPGVRIKKIDFLDGTVFLEPTGT